MLDILRTGFFVAVWKIVVFIVTAILLYKIAKSAADSWKRSGGSLMSVLDEVLIGLIVLAGFFLLASTDLATIMSKIMPTIQWIFNTITDAFSRATGIPIG